MTEGWGREDVELLATPAAVLVLLRLPCLAEDMPPFYQLALLSLLVGLAQPFDYIDCGSVLGSYSKISISECDPPTGSFCNLRKGTNATLSVDFIPNEDVAKVEAVVHGIIGSVPIPFNLPNPDGCIESGLQCPLQKGENYTYKATLPVLEAYPKVRVTVKWELKYDNKDVICFQLPAKIV